MTSTTTVSVEKRICGALIAAGARLSDLLNESGEANPIQLWVVSHPRSGATVVVHVLIGRGSDSVLNEAFELQCRVTGSNGWYTLESIRLVVLSADAIRGWPAQDLKPIQGRKLVALSDSVPKADSATAVQQRVQDATKALALASPVLCAMMSKRCNMDAVHLLMWDCARYLTDAQTAARTRTTFDVTALRFDQFRTLLDALHLARFAQLQKGSLASASVPTVDMWAVGLLRVVSKDFDLSSVLEDGRPLRRRDFAGNDNTMSSVDGIQLPLCFSDPTQVSLLEFDKLCQVPRLGYLLFRMCASVFYWPDRAWNGLLESVAPKTADFPLDVKTEQKTVVSSSGAVASASNITTATRTPAATTAASRPAASASPAPAVTQAQQRKQSNKKKAA